MIYRPALAEPPLCSWLECEKINLTQLMDMHEALDLRAAQIDKSRKESESNRGNRR